MPERIGIVVLLLPVLFGCAGPETLPVDYSTSLATVDLQRDLATIVPPLLEKYKTPGASVAVIVDREVVLQTGFGHLSFSDDAPAVDESTVFQAASLSKPVVAYGVHRLVVEGAGGFHLDRPLTDYRLPDEPYKDDRRLEKITPRLVLCHTTGFPNWRRGYRSDNPKPLQLKRDPGTEFGYSGEGYIYLQRVIEQITGDSLDVYLRQHVLDPLGMTSSSYVWEERFEPIHARPHDGKGREEDKWRPDEALASGTLQTTAADYARFLLATLGDGPSDEAGVDWLAQESTIDERIGWSLGWGVEQTPDGPLFWQWGDDGPFKALVAGSRDKGVAVVVLTNGKKGLNVARPVIERVLGSDLAFLDFRMIWY